LIPDLDCAIRRGAFPPVIIVAPDGGIHTRMSIVAGGSFYLNSRAGRYEDYIVQDIWPWAQRTFRIRPERGARVIAGASMGGYGAFMIGFRHRGEFGAIAGILPALDIRYADCHDDYFRPYDPNCVIERDNVRRDRVIARYFGIPVREKRLTDPLLGKDAPDGLKPLAAVNPVEMLESLSIQPGEFEMFIGSAGQDNFNLNAGTDHFLDVARRRGIEATHVFRPTGQHTIKTGKTMLPEFSHWINRVLAPYQPGSTPAMLTTIGPAYDILANQYQLYAIDPSNTLLMNYGTSTDSPPARVARAGMIAAAE
jgi:S-formylglutathione hydrolase FrmB